MTDPDLPDHRPSEAVRMLDQFHRRLGQPFSCPDLGSVAIRRKLHAGEHAELLDAFDRGDRGAMAHELADNVYVAYGTAHVFGFPLDAVLAEVHRANMSKLDSTEGPVLDSDGKVRKPAGFVPPDVEGVLVGHAVRDHAAAVLAANLMIASIGLIGVLVGVVLAVGVLMLAPGAQVWLLSISVVVAVVAAFLSRRTLSRVSPAVALPTSRTDPDL